MKRKITKGAMVALLLTLVAGVAGAAQVSVENTQAESDGQANVDVTLDEAPDGLQRYKMTVTLDDGSVGSIQDVEAGAVEGFQVVSSGSDSVTFRAADLSKNVQSDSSDVRLATVVVNTQSGSSEVDADVNEMLNDNGEQMNADVSAGTLTTSSGGGGIPSQGSLLITLTAIASVVSVAGAVAWRRRGS